MFKKKVFQVKMVDDPDTKTIFVPGRPHDYEKLSEVVWVQTRNIALCVGAVFVAKNVSAALGMTISNVVWRIVDVKFPYPPIKY